MGRGGGVTPHAVPVAVSEGGSSAEGLALQFLAASVWLSEETALVPCAHGQRWHTAGHRGPPRLVGWEPRLAAELVSVPLHSQAGDPRTACTDPLGARRDSYC